MGGRSGGKMLPQPEDALSPRQRQFVAEYLKDLNGSQAVIRAGYSANGATVQAVRLLRNPKIARFVAEGVERRLKDAGVDATKILEAVAVLAHGDVRGLYTEAGSLKPIHELTAQQASLIDGIEMVTRSHGEGEVEHVTKIKRVPKLKALELLMRYLQLLVDKSEHTIDGDIRLRWKEREPR